MGQARQFNLRQFFTLVSVVCVATALLREAIAMPDPLNLIFLSAFGAWVTFWLDWVIPSWMMSR